MKIIVGLGNPGIKYRRTRHNLGFMVVDTLAAQRNLTFRRGRNRGKCLQVEGQIGKEQVLLVKPLTYMNLSGESVSSVVNYYHLPLEDFLVVCDDVHLDLGRLRMRRSGSAGGHNGMESIIKQLGSEVFPRLRIGVGEPPEWMDMMSYVLGVFPRTEAKQLPEIIARAVMAVETWIYYGVDEAMNKYNA